MQLIIYGGRLPRDFCPSGAMHVCLATGRASAFFVPYRQTRPALPGKAKQTCYMETNVIQRKDTRVAAINEWLAAKTQSLSKWYNGRSRFYSKLTGFEVKWKTAVRVNLFSLFVVITAVVAAQQPLVSAVSAVCSAWVAYRLNSDGKKGGRK